MGNKLRKNDLKYLEECVDLAEESLKQGDEPFGSLLVNDKDEIIARARNRVNELNVLAHPEIELAHWAAEHLNREERRRVTMFTSGEHCPMCAAALGWVGIGQVVYLSSGKQLRQWLKEAKAPGTPIRFIPIEEVVPDVEVRGPGDGELLNRIRELQLQSHSKG